MSKQELRRTKCFLIDCYSPKGAWQMHCAHTYLSDGVIYGYRNDVNIFVKLKQLQMTHKHIITQ